MLKLYQLTLANFKMPKPLASCQYLRSEMPQAIKSICPDDLAQILIMWVVYVVLVCSLANNSLDRVSRKTREPQRQQGKELVDQHSILGDYLSRLPVVILLIT